MERKRFDKIKEVLGVVKEIENGFATLCPTHKDTEPSLNVVFKDEKCLLKCWAGCDNKDIIEALKSKNAWPSKEETKSNPEFDFFKQIKKYDYKDKDGNILYSQVRGKTVNRGVVIKEKVFKTFYPNNNKVKKEDRVLYRLKTVLNQAENQKRIILVEGEEDVHAAESLKLPATTCSHGSGAWLEHYSDSLKGAEVIICPDNDLPGEKWAKKVAESFQKRDIKFKIIDLGLKNKGADLRDWVNAGGNRDALIEIINQTEVKKAVIEEVIEISDEERMTNIVLKKIGRENIKYVNGNIYTYNNNGLWQIISIDELKNIIRNCKIPKITSHRVKGICNNIKEECFDKIEWNKERFNLNCLNGEIHYDKKDKGYKFLPHKRESYCTAQTQVHYDPEATAPNWENYIQTVFEGDSDANEKRLLIQEMMAYSMMRHCKFEKFFLLKGEAGRGKSMMIETILNMIGKENCSTVSYDKLGSRFSTAALLNKTANLASEIESDYSESEEVLKKVVSGESINVEFKGKDCFDMTPFCTLIFAGNKLPPVRDKSMAVFQRVIVVGFNNLFRDTDKQDVNLKDKLRAEKSGIFNWVIKGYCRLLRKEKFTIPSSHYDILEKWKLDNNSILQFLLENPIQCRRQLQDLYDLYKLNCEENGISRQFICQKYNFGNRLRELGYDVHRSTSGMFFVEPDVELDDLSEYEQ